MKIGGENLVMKTCDANLKAQSEGAAKRPETLRRFIGAISFAVAMVLTSWLLLGILHVVPLVLQLPGESTVRSHAGAAVLLLLIAAWGYWEN